MSLDLTYLVLKYLLERPTLHHNNDVGSMNFVLTLPCFIGKSNATYFDLILDSTYYINTYTYSIYSTAMESFI